MEFFKSKSNGIAKLDFNFLCNISLLFSVPLNAFLMQLKFVYYLKQTDSTVVMNEIKKLLFKGYARKSFLSHKIFALCSKNVKC